MRADGVLERHPGSDGVVMNESGKVVNGSATGQLNRGTGHAMSANNPDEIPRELGDIDGFTELQGPRGNKLSTEFTRRRGDERVIKMNLYVDHADEAELDEATRIVGCRRETVPEEEDVITTPPYTTRVTVARSSLV